MKKDFWIGLIAVFAITIILGSLIKYWDSPDINKIISLIGVVVSAATIVFVVGNTNRQIKNQNKESRKPYLVIKHIKDFTSDDIIQSINQNIIKYRTNSKQFYKTHNKLCINIDLENMGYGIAHNITIFKAQKELSYKINTIGEYQEWGVNDLNIAPSKDGTLTVEIEECEFAILSGKSPYTFIQSVICYSDLNGNIYTILLYLEFIISANEKPSIIRISAKSGTENYDEWVEEWKVNKEEVIDRYKKYHLEIK